MNTYLETTQVSEVKVSKDGRNFKTVQFQPLMDEIMIAGKLRTVKSNQPARTKNLWEKGPNDSKGDALYNGITVGDIVKGQIVSATVNPYIVGERTVTSATVVVLDNQTIETAFKNQGHTFPGQESTTNVVKEVVEVASAFIGNAPLI